MGDPPNPNAAPEGAARSPAQRVLLVTGMSGAGRTSCLKALEDIGYEAVDNVPLALLPALLASGQDGGRPVAVGVDIRTRDFGTDRFLAELQSLRAAPDTAARLLFLDCDPEVLSQRFTETRRRHPLAADRPVSDGIRLESNLLEPIREQADLVVGTTALLPSDLRRTMWETFALDPRQGIALTVISFAFRRGLPRDADLVFDVRFLRNPHYDPDLRPRDGRDPAVGAYVAQDPDFAPFFARLTGMLEPLLPRFYREGKTYLTIAVGCTGGKHRSVYLAERLRAWLAAQGQRVGVVHRDVDRV